MADPGKHYFGNGLFCGTEHYYGEIAWIGQHHTVQDAASTPAYFSAGSGAAFGEAVFGEAMFGENLAPEMVEPLYTLESATAPTYAAD